MKLQVKKILAQKAKNYVTSKKHLITENYINGKIKHTFSLFFIA